MNFMKLYIGDYMRDTGMLSVTEHGAYLLMLMNHYATGRPLPVGRELHRLLRAETKVDRDAIDRIATRFWTVDASGGLVNKRAEVEIEKANHQRDVNRIVGQKGGRPKRTETESVTESVTESEPNRNPHHSQINTIPSESKDSGETPDPIFGDGLAYLVGTGVDERGARSFLGKLRRSVGDMQAVELIAKARTGAVSEPLAWLRKAAERRMTSGRSSTGVAL